MPYIYASEGDTVVEVKKSKLPGAGKGLFAKMHGLKKGDSVALYFGVSVWKDQIDRGYYASDYLLRKRGHPWIIDGADPLSCKGRWINDSLSLEKTNAEFVFPPMVEGGSFHAEIHLTKNVRKGTEIYISYGPTFWEDMRRHNSPGYTNLSQGDKNYIEDMINNA